jgi:hypothetical protein
MPINVPSISVVLALVTSKSLGITPKCSIFNMTPRAVQPPVCFGTVPRDSTMGLAVPWLGNTFRRVGEDTSGPTYFVSESRYLCPRNEFY